MGRQCQVRGGSLCRASTASKPPPTGALLCGLCPLSAIDIITDGRQAHIQAEPPAQQQHGPQQLRRPDDGVLCVIRFILHTNKFTRYL